MKDKTVYVLGAGFNQFLEDFDGATPPLARDFFKKAFNKRKFNEKIYLNQIQDLLAYVEHYWHLDLSDLKKEDIDLEEIFTLIQLQVERAKAKRNYKELRKLIEISFKLETFFSESLSDFMPINPRRPTGYSFLVKFGKLLLQHQPTIITFNYDTLLEEGIKSASGVATPPKSYLSPLDATNRSKKLPASLIKYSHSNWNHILSYGFKFNYISLPQAGMTQIVKQQDYYGKGLNDLYKMQILKLHGSLNWMETAGPLDRNAWGNKNHFSWREFPAQIQKEEGTIYYPGHWHFGMPPLLGTWFLRPKIITPVLYKDSFYNRRPFPDLWKKALYALKQCKRLIIIGYSFPPTDFSTKILFLEAFSENLVEELVLVNPDKSGTVEKIAKKLTHFSKPTFYKSAQEYIRSLEL